MAKKQKRSVPQGSRPSTPPGSSSTATPRTPAAARPVGGRSPVSGLRPSASADFNPDYTYAKQDLKRVAVMAGSFIAALIVLSFVLPLFIK
jgi:hypothetical protein